ncbi:MAG: hypothetical protein K2X32_02225 [Phycisphaerales bacterium]|nr:hypothetical protein [Phycisphaerales bacterium]
MTSRITPESRPLCAHQARCAIALLTLTCGAPAMAQLQRGPFAPGSTTAFVVTGSPNRFISVNLNGQQGPAGTYTRANLSVDWAPASNNPGGLNAQWQSDARMAITSQAYTGLAPIVASTIYCGAPSGLRPTTALDSAVAGTITWDNIALDTPFVADGTEPLFLLFRSSFANGGDSLWSNISVTLLPPLPPLDCPRTETEPNDTKLTATVISSDPGDSVCGVSFGADESGTDFSIDFVNIATARHPGIRRRQARLISNGVPPLMNLVGRSQTAGVPGSGVVNIQPGEPIGDNTLVTWYTLGTAETPNARTAIVAIAGDIATSDGYKLEILSVDPVQPAALARTVRPGAVTISTAGTSAADTDLWILDSNFDLIPGWGNDDRLGATDLQSTLTRTIAPGTYYLAIGQFPMAVAEPSPSDDRFRSGVLTDFPGVMICGVVSGPARDFTITDAAGSFVTPSAPTLPHEIIFYRLDVTNSGAAITRCNPADIANDGGQPINNPPAPADPEIPNNGTTEADYNVFFASFFDALNVCDIAADTGTPLPPFGSGGTGSNVNNGVTESDYNLFFSIFFDGCTL